MTQTERLQFEQRYSSEDQMRVSVKKSLNDYAANIDNARAKARELLDSLQGPGRSRISRNMRRIQEPHLQLMFRTVANLGLERWAPDVLSGDADSMYNLLHEYIALQTFAEVSTAFGYTHMANNLSYLQSPSLLRKLYRSFVFSHFFRIAKLEEKGEGTVEKKMGMVNVWKRRKMVFTSCL